MDLAEIDFFFGGVTVNAEKMYIFCVGAYRYVVTKVFVTTSVVDPILFWSYLTFQKFSDLDLVPNLIPTLKIFLKKKNCFYTGFKQCCGSGSVSFLRDPDLLPPPPPGCLGSGSVSCSNGITELTGRENLTKNTFCVGPVGPTDKENQLKVFKSTFFRYITSLKR